MSTVAYRSSATATTTTTTDGSSVTITKPAGTASGDTLVAVLSGYLASTLLTVPTGWTLVNTANDGVLLYSWVYQKIAGGSEPTNYTFTWTSSVGALTGSIAAFSGGNGVDTCISSVTGTTTAAGGAAVYPRSAAMRYDVHCWRNTATDSITWSIGTAEIFDIVTAGSGSVIWRGQSGIYSSAVNAANVSINANTATLATAPTAGIQWSMGIADAKTPNEPWASTGWGVDLKIGTTWTDITSYLRQDAGVDISRGADAEGSDPNPSSCTFQLDNRDGRFSPRNPTGPYYGSIGRNTQVRVWKALSTVQGRFTGLTSDVWRMPSGPASLPQGTDMDIRVDAEPESWRCNQILAAQGNGRFSTSGTRWVFYVDDDGYVHLATGAALLANDFKSTLPLPAAIRQSVRATYDADNGAAGSTVAFYTSDSVTGTWTQLGTSVIYASTNPIGSGAGYDLTIGGVAPDNSANGFTYFPGINSTTPVLRQFRGNMYAARMYSDLTSTTVIASPDFTAQSTGTYSFQDSVGNVWVGFGNCVALNRRYRFWGEVANWPQRWDTSGKDVYVPVECAGVMRRLGQGTTPIKSAMYRYYTSTAGIYMSPSAGGGAYGPYYPKAYWPMEDNVNSTQFLQAMSGQRNARVSKGTPTFANYTGFNASSAIPNMKSGSTVVAPVVGASSGGGAVEFIISAPSGITNGAVIMNIALSGTNRTVEVSYPATDTWLMRSLDVDGTQLATSGNFTVPTAGKLNHVLIRMQGTSVRFDYEEQSSLPTYTSSAGVLSLTATAGANTGVTINPNGTMTDVYMGHLAVFDGTASAGLVYGTNSVLYSNSSLALYSPLSAYRGETSGSRARRLATEQGLSEYCVGGSGVPVGWQRQLSFVDLMKGLQDSDFGMVYEPRNLLGIGYRNIKSLYNQAAIMTFVYGNPVISGSLEPDEDDKNTRNDVTVTRDGGGTSRYTDAVSLMGTLAPPSGVGLYDDSQTVSLADDSQAYDNAAWRVHLGTVNELRWKSISTNLYNTGVSSNTALQVSILACDVGDRIVLSGQPAWIPPDQISQIIVGYTEHIDNFEHSFSFFTAPESAYQIAQAKPAGTSSTQFKADTAGSTLNGTMTTTATSVSVTTATGNAVWTTSGVAFDIMVAGERMTVTAVTGAASPQTFTVTRSVNGVVKSHVANESIVLFKPGLAAL